MKSACALCASLVVLTTMRSFADIELGCGHAALRLSEKAVPSALALPDGADALNRFYREPLADVQSPDGVWHRANAARKAGQTLILGFEGVDTVLTLALDDRPDWLGIRIESLKGTRPRAVRFVKLNTAFTETVGQRLNIGWNATHALAVLATSPQTQTRVDGQPCVTLDETVAAVNRGEAGVNPRVCLTVTASDTASARLEGSSAAVLVCATPDFDALAKRVAQTYALPTRAETASETLRHSYFRLKAGADLHAADGIIALCKESGLRHVLIPWDGIRTTEVSGLAARLRDAGLSVGVRCTAAAPATAQSLAGLVDTAGIDFVCFETSAGNGCDADAYTAFQEQALRLIRRPVAFAGNLLTHRLWHVYGRCTTSESYLDVLNGIRVPAGHARNVRQHVDAGISALDTLRCDRMAGEIGFGMWSSRHTQGREIEGLQLDDFEYVLSRSIAYDCPLALEIDPDEFARNPLSQELLRLLGLYEQARLGRRIPEAEKAAMRQPGQGFTLVQRRAFQPVIVPTRASPCGTSARARATVGSFEGGSVATFWTTSGSADVTLDLSPFVARIADFDDRRVVVQKSADDRLVLPVGPRRLTLFCPTLAPEALEQKIKKSLCADASRSL